MDKGLKILLNTYKPGFTRSFEPLSDEEKADFEAARSEGYMFDYPKPVSHKETLERLAEILPKISGKSVADAFLYSLSTRELQYRSALGSYYYAAAIPLHGEDSANECSVCGWQKWKSAPCNYELRRGLNLYNYWRYKFGTCRSQLDYVLFDLEQFIKLPAVVPRAEDIEILKRILGCVDYLNGGDRVTKLEKAVIHEKLFKTNKYEVSSLLESLGVCGVLTCAEYPCFEERFITFREARCLQRNEYDYPVNMWCAWDGINEERLFKVFGIEA